MGAPGGARSGLSPHQPKKSWKTTMSSAATVSMPRILRRVPDALARRRNPFTAPRSCFVASRRVGRMLGNMGGIDPIVVSVDVSSTAERAFEHFVAGFAGWWPVVTHSLSRSAATRCRLDATPGGTLEERAPDGARHLWGTVESVEPGRRLRFSWHPGRGPESAQWVDVEFKPVGTCARVTLTHGGWEALGEIAPILRREYASGWRDVLENNFAGCARESH